ncbi:MAG TPA: nuclear transport factor 2 family protein [Mycobacterium sp.]|nr:nuclear transport factor 2 family protein [Mycobacterium sp.]
MLAIGEDFAAAIVSNDAARIAEFMADDWVMVSETGVSARQDFLALIESGQLSHSAMQRISDARVRVYGETAVVTARVTNTAHFQDQRFDADEWTTDVYVRRDGRWVCALTHITAAAAPDSQS